MTTRPKESPQYSLYHTQPYIVVETWLVSGSGLCCQCDDLLSSSVSWRFPSLCYFNPPLKAGCVVLPNGASKWTRGCSLKGRRKWTLKGEVASDEQKRNGLKEQRPHSVASLNTQMMLKAREQPMFSTRAHVFQIDPATKRNWLPASKHAVTVSFFYDASRNVYRIISVGGTKAIINSTITPNMTFTKTSQKFGQWADSRANTVYGLGFSTEQQLQQFAEQFKEVKEAARLAREKSQERFELANPGLNIAAPQPSREKTLLDAATLEASIPIRVQCRNKRRVAAMVSARLHHAAEPTLWSLGLRRVHVLPLIRERQQGICLQ
ncbi:hypothetical protein CCH79_00009370 [Gambusia affinis]|uniref:WH1 domain-containing protein n=1 Tax=Gambusia affinis TaxID=33528 RepID=A0A315VPJ6_GAMAF|nr:hypothetical protein CCH79_00009370 [Gambusia affinis]